MLPGTPGLQIGYHSTGNFRGNEIFAVFAVGVHVQK